MWIAYVVVTSVTTTSTKFGFGVARGSRGVAAVIDARQASNAVVKKLDFMLMMIVKIDDENRDCDGKDDAQETYDNGPQENE